MASRELTTLSEFIQQHINTAESILKLWYPQKDERFSTDERIFGFANFGKFFPAAKQLCRSFGDESRDFLLERFDEIPWELYYDLLIANTTLSEDVKREICNLHIDKILDPVRSEVVEVAGNFYIEKRIEVFRGKYPPFFEQAYEEYLSRNPVQTFPLYFIENFSEDFFARTIDIWLNRESEHFGDNINGFAHTRSWTFLERYVVPAVFGEDSDPADVWIFLFPAQYRRIIPESFLDRLIEKDVKYSFIYAVVVPEITKEYINLVQRKIFNRLDRDAAFVARFKYQDLSPDDVEIPITETFFNREPTLRAQVIKTAFLWLLAGEVFDGKTEDVSDGVYEKLIVANYPMLISILENKRQVAERFLSMSFEPETFISLGDYLDQGWWLMLASSYRNMRLWTYPKMLRIVRSSPNLREALLKNTNLTLNIVELLDPISYDETLILLGNPLPVQKAFDEELRTATQAEDVLRSYFESEGTPHLRALSGLREAKSFYPPL